jgi:hypothetical protein
MPWPPASLDRRRFAALAGSAAGLLAGACGRSGAQEAGGAVAGAEVSAGSRALAMGADLLQSKGPVEDINMYLDGFHFYADDMGRQVEAHHYCTHVSEDFFQCVIYDGDRSGARLIGIEYIVSARVFASLPEDEKPLWHSHRHETLSGELVMPGIPGPIERTALATLVTTYGKTWHTWQVDRDPALPLGIPQLMMGFTGDGQLDPRLLQARDRRLGIASGEEREARRGLAADAPPVQPGADAWQDGRTLQLALREVPLANRRG